MHKLLLSTSVGVFALLSVGAAKADELLTLQKDPKQWARESFELAKEKVYVAEIRKQIIAADLDEKRPAHGVFVKLPDGYQDRACVRQASDTRSTRRLPT